MKKLGRMWTEEEKAIVFSVLEALSADYYIIPKSEMNPLKEQAGEALASLEEWLKEDGEKPLERFDTFPEEPSEDSDANIGIDMMWWAREKHQPNYIADYWAQQELLYSPKEEGSDAEEE